MMVNLVGLIPLPISIGVIMKQMEYPFDGFTLEMNIAFLPKVYYFRGGRGGAPITTVPSITGTRPGILIVNRSGAEPRSAGRSPAGPGGGSPLHRKVPLISLHLFSPMTCQGPISGGGAHRYTA